MKAGPKKNVHAPVAVRGVGKTENGKWKIGAINKALDKSHVNDTTKELIPQEHTPSVVHSWSDIPSDILGKYFDKNLMK